MARHSLRVVVVLGMLITLVGGTGIYATISDRALTGPSDVTSDSLARAANLGIAQLQLPPNNGPFTCDRYFDDLTSPLFTFIATPGRQADAYFCVVNSGSRAVDVTLTSTDVTDLDVACTGDEAAFGDTTCGSVGGIPQVGELSPNLTVETDLYQCDTGALLSPGTPDFTSSLAGLGTIPYTTLGTLLPGTQLCLRLRVYWASTGDLGQVSQSDEVTWRFAFDGTVP